jgi:hypothetical protein
VLPPETGVLLERALEAAMEALYEPTDQTESNDSAEARRADALVLLAEHFLGCEAERCPSTAERYEVVVHIGEAQLREPATEDDLESVPRLCELEHGPALAAETARRLGCGSRLRGLVEGAEGEVLDIGRRTRAIPPAMKRALQARDSGCRFPGCERTRHTEGHHVRHWADGGETKLSNLVTLCKAHHRRVHEGGFGLRVTDDGLFVFSGPDGRRIEESGSTERCFRGNIEALNADLGLLIDASTCRSRWLGEPLDYSLAIEALARHRSRDAGTGAMN